MKEVFSIYKRALLPVILFELAFKLATLLLFRPVLGFFMRLGNGTALFNYDILSFASGLSGMITLCLLTVMAAFYTYFEFSVLIFLFYRASAKKPVSIRYAAIMSFASFQSLRSLSFPAFALYCLFLLPLADCGLSSSLVPIFKIPHFISNELSASFWGQLLLALFSLIVFLLFFLLLFTLPAMCLGKISFGRACGQSFLRIRHTPMAVLLFLLGCILLWRILFVMPGLLPGYFSGITGSTFLEILRSIILSLRIVPFLAFLISLLIQISLSFLLLSGSVWGYLQSGGQVIDDEHAARKIEWRLTKTTSFALAVSTFLAKGMKRLLAPVRRQLNKSFFYRKHKKAVQITAGILSVLLILSFFNTPYFLHDPITIGHRGSSYGVENTISAVEGAIDAGAQYVEIDVQLSSDGVPMVYHDTNLKRLTGQNRPLYTMTAEELSSLTLSQNGQTGQISTLEEIIRFCQGKIGLLLDLKLNGHETKSLAAQVLTVVEENDALDFCLFQSLNLELIQEIKSLSPDSRAGYCIFANTGSLTVSSLRNLNVDFLSVEESFLSRNFILKCQKAWLPVYVWTVNQPSDMEKYLDMGVCGFITDYPDKAAGLIEKTIGREPVVPYSTTQFPQWE